MTEQKRLTADELAAIWQHSGRISHTHREHLALRGHIAALEADLAAAEAVCEAAANMKPLVQGPPFRNPFLSPAERVFGEAYHAWRKRRAERGTR